MEEEETFNNCAGEHYAVNNYCTDRYDSYLWKDCNSAAITNESNAVMNDASKAGLY